MIRHASLVLVLFAAPVLAQTIPSVGTSLTLDVATWNVEHFGNPDSGPSNDDLQLSNVLSVMRQADIDLWALQEMDIESEFVRLLDSLGTGFDGFWQADNTSFDVGYGFIYKTSVVQPVQINTILESSDYEFAFRPPLEMSAVITLPDTTVEVRFIDIHMKCCADQESYDRRVAASGILKNYTDNLQAIGVNVLVLGDFNDELIMSIYANQTSPYQNFLDDDEYVFVTEDFDLPGTSNDTDTFCSNSSCTSGSVIDHMVATSDLGDDYQTDSADHFFDLIAAIPDYTSTTSDHLPVYARFDFLGDTGGSVTVSCTPVSPPIVIPMAGGIYTFDLAMENTGAASQSFDLWIFVDGPGGEHLQRGPIPITLAPGELFARSPRQQIPGMATAGDWTHECNIGAFPTADATSAFGFTKSAVFAPGGVSMADWTTEAEFAAALRAPELRVEVPSNYVLEGSYPNPFNPHTTIRFSLPESAQVRLVVYDVLGRQVRVLLDGTREAGTHEVVFDADGLPSGTYLYRLETPQGSFVRTMLLAK